MMSSQSARALLPSPHEHLAPVSERRECADLAHVAPTTSKAPRATAEAPFPRLAGKSAVRLGVARGSQSGSRPAAASSPSETLVFRIAGRNQQCRALVSADAGSPQQQFSVALPVWRQCGSRSRSPNNLKQQWLRRALAEGRDVAAGGRCLCKRRRRRSTRTRRDSSKGALSIRQFDLPAIPRMRRRMHRENVAVRTYAMHARRSSRGGDLDECRDC